MERHVIYTNTQEGEELRPDSHWTKPFTSTEPAHANSHQIMVFQKGGGTFNPQVGEILYYQYSENESGHPCPYAPETIAFVLNRYFTEGGVVLDPFMGVAPLGREVLKRGGTFIGYELEKKFCDIAEGFLKEVD